MEKYLTVDALTKYIKYKFDSDEHLQKIYLKGEISNFKAHSSGHFYFSIKDEKSKINAIMFKSQNSKLKFKPIEGMKVLIIGRVSVFEQAGSYQIYVEEMNEDGVGNLYLAYEQLKKKLEQEGLFLEKHKKEIPKFPNKIGVVTAPTGAAVKDIIATLQRRYPISEVFLFPCLVQGEKAYLDIIDKLKQADQFNIDVIILGRGGGSIEDLWAFNEEELARVIFECQTPIISAVGHEIDFTISDFVSDLRAPTPTAAAELAVPNLIDILKNIDNYKNRANEAIKQKIQYQYLILNNLKNNYILKNPLLFYENKKQLLDNLVEKINEKIIVRCQQQRQHLNNLKNNYILKNPHYLYQNEKQQLSTLISQIKLLNPLNILERGYSVTYYNEKPLTNVKDIRINDIIKTRLSKGTITAKIIKKEAKNEK